MNLKIDRRPYAARPAFVAAHAEVYEPNHRPWTLHSLYFALVQLGQEGVPHEAAVHVSGDRLWADWQEQPS